MTKKKLIKTIEDSGCEMITFKAEFMFTIEEYLELLKLSDSYFSEMQEGVDWKGVNFYKVLVVGGTLNQISKSNNSCFSTNMGDAYKKKEVV